MTFFVIMFEMVLKYNYFFNIIVLHEFCGTEIKNSDIILISVYLFTTYKISYECLINIYLSKIVSIVCERVILLCPIINVTL